MRIVGGALSGRKIEPPLTTTTRPMMDRVREALFNILAHRDWGKNIGELFEGELSVLDAFCGTGALAFEAISWGATQATLFDKDLDAVKTTRTNATSLGIFEKCHIYPCDATKPPSNSGGRAKLIFLAPPYRKELTSPAYVALEEAGWISPHALIVCETAKSETLPLLKGCELILSRNYGDTALHFMSR